MTRTLDPRRIQILAATALLCCASVIATAQTSARSRQMRARSSSPVAVRARGGDTLAALAARFQVPVEALAQANNLRQDAPLQAGQQVIIPLLSAAQRAQAPPPPSASPVTEQASRSNRLRLVDGTVIEFDDAWEDAQGLWYRKGGMVHLVARNRVAAIERKTEKDKRDDAQDERGAAKAPTQVKIVEVSQAQSSAAPEPVWIFLVGGARVEADEVTETPAGAWYRRGSLSIFLDRSRIERIERERPVVTAGNEMAATGAWTERGWTTGNQKIDQLIRQSGQAHGVDPYLIFCVMEQESRFNMQALSPKGASGLMQLMPGTAARFGVRNIFDPQQNIMGGTRYLKMLLEQFGGRVDLVLASYNAGEGAVMKYGGNVPPYRETRDYVRRIGARYGQTNSQVQPVVMTKQAARAARPK